MKFREIVTLWRQTGAPEVELAAHNAAGKLARTTWPDAPKALHAAWIERGQQPDDEAVVELMRVSDFAKHTAKQLLERLELMASWEPHPTATRWLVDVFARQTRAPLLAGQKCFRRVFNLLVDHVDVAGAARLESWLGTHTERIAASPYAAEFFDDGIRRVLAKSAKRRAGMRALTPKERARLDDAGLLVEPQVPAAEVTLDSLYAAIYEAPWDDGPRAVLADALQEQDDPRGELIALELLVAPTPAQTRRRNELLKKHGKAWFPEALNRVVKRSAEYERGFLAFGELTTTERTAIELATFRELRVIPQWEGAVPQFDHAAFRGVESWLGVQLARTARWLEHAPVPRVRRLGVAIGMRKEPDELLEVIRPEAWPNVTEIVLEASLDGSWEYERPHAPAMFSALPRTIGAQLPQVKYVDVRPFARFDRDGRLLSDVFLPPMVAGALVDEGTHAYQRASRRRWIAWLHELGAPVVIDAPRYLDELRRRLEVTVSVGEPRPIARMER